MRKRIRATLARLADWTPDAMQVAGIGAFVAGAFTLAPWLGLFVLGAGLCVVGRALGNAPPPADDGGEA